MADSGGKATFIGWMKGMQTLASEGPGEIVEKVANLTHEAMINAVNSGVNIDGDEWAPTVEGGRKAYPNAEKYIDVSPVGNSVVITIRGPLVFANWGTRKMVARKSLPSRGLPKKLGNAIRLGYVELCKEFMSRSGRHDRSGKTRWNPQKAGTGGG